MRTCSRQGNPNVCPVPGTVRPIKMHLCGMTYRMEPHEAIALANLLVDAVEDLNTAHAVITDTEAHQ